MIGSCETALHRAHDRASSAYEHGRKRQTLFRILAHNIVRELQDTGYRPPELIGFASEIAREINDCWDEPVQEGRTGHARPLSTPRPVARTVDSCGRVMIMGDTTLLRVPTEADRPALERWSEDPMVQRSLFPPVLRHVLHHLPDMHTQVDRLDMIVLDRATESSIGLVSLHHIDHAASQAELGKMIGEPAYRGRGAAHEATRLIVTYGFEHLQLNRIHLRTLGGNLRNIKLNEGMGFSFEGVLRQAAAVDGKRTDVVLMARLRSEYFSAQGPPDGEADRESGYVSSPGQPRTHRSSSQL